MRAKPQPTLLLAASYGAAALVAIALVLFGAHVTTSLLVFWLGGPLAILPLTQLPLLRPIFIQMRREFAPCSSAEGSIFRS